MKIAVLGAGSIGSRHIKNLTELGHNVEVYDPTHFTASTRGEVLHFTAPTRDEVLDEIIPNSDAVIIATPTSNHVVDIYDCHMAGKPMFVEKPLVDSYTDWISVPTDNIKMVGYNLRFHSCVKKVKEWMGEGRIGKPIWAQFTCAQFNDRPEYLRDGVVLNWSHEIDLAVYLIGVAEFVAAAVTKKDDMADIALRHEHTGCQTVVHLDYLTKPEKRGFWITGEEGSICADLVQRTAWIKKDNKVVELYAGQDNWNGNYLDEMRKFIDRLNGKEVIGCTAAEALLVNGLCFQAKGVALAGK